MQPCQWNTHTSAAAKPGLAGCCFLCIADIDAIKDRHPVFRQYCSPLFVFQDAKAALNTLADSYKPEDIGEHCYHLYEQFRPTIASGQKGWGQKGQLDLVQIKGLAEQH